MRLPLLVLPLLLPAVGCGIVSKDLDGTVRFNFEINDDENHFESVEEFDPNSNEDVKNNRDKVEAGSVVEIALELTEVLAGNEARMVAGQIDVKKASEPDSAYIQAVGQWSGIPLYDSVGNPALGQVFKLEIPVDTQDKLSDIVFRETEMLNFRFNGYGFDDYLQPLGPVRLRGQVEVTLNFTVSAP